MDLLSTLWIFDERWFFGFQPSERILWIPLILNIAHYSKLYLLETSDTNPSQSIRLLLIFLILISLFFHMQLYNKKSQILKKIDQNTPNKSNIIQFLYRLKMKKIVWGKLGINLCGASLLTNFVNLMGVYSDGIPITFIGKIWFFANIGSLLYIIGFFLLFVLKKCSYLLVAWKFPKLYLKHRKIVH